MLDYLLPSETRRGLLTALVIERASGTASSLARRVGVTRAGAARELGAMVRVGLAERALESGHLIYKVAHTPHLPALQALLSLPAGSAPSLAPAAAFDPARAQNDLAALGARLPGHLPAVRTTTPLFLALARGVVLSRDDVAVAQSLPALLSRHKRELDFDAFALALEELRHKHTAGFLLALTAQLTSDPELAARAEALRDHRRTRLVEFFSPRADPKPAPDAQTLEVAAHWGFRFPMLLANFEVG